MREDQEERIVVSFEKIAVALEGLHDEAKRAGLRFWPQQREQREAIVTRVESDRDRELRLQGARRRSISEITDPVAEEQEEDYEIIGERTRQYLRDHPEERKKTEVADASPEGARQAEHGGAEKIENQG